MVVCWKHSFIKTIALEVWCVRERFSDEFSLEKYQSYITNHYIYSYLEIHMDVSYAKKVGRILFFDMRIIILYCSTTYPLPNPVNGNMIK